MKSKFSERKFRGDEVLVIRKLTKSYDERKLIDIDELDIHAGEKIAIIGDNGSGKTTLVKLILGEEKQDSGNIKLGPAIKPAYLPQIVKFENPHRNLIETLLYDLNVTPQTARNRLGAFMFFGDDVFKLVGDLSGGEKSRLRLCMLMDAEINLLILDEPTNHLDLASREWIEDALEDYNETLVFISHDRYFINKYATRIWNIENGKFTDFLGTYSEYVAYVTANQNIESSKKVASVSSKVRQKPKKPSDAQKELRRVEREIEKLENDLDENKQQAIKYSTNYEKLMELSQQEIKLQEQLDELLEQWEVYAQ